MDITTAAPAEIDAEFAELWARESQIEDRRELVSSTLKYAAGFERIQTRSGSYFREDYAAALAAVEPVLAEHTDESDYAAYPAAKNTGSTRLGQVRSSVTEVHELTAKLAANREAQAPLDAEYTRRGGWARFFIAQTNDGHIHSSTNCSSCNKGRSATRFGWVTEFSGQDEAGIVALAGERACTVCFPSAPAVGPVDARFRTDKEIAADERKAEKARKDAEKARKAAARAAKG